MTITIPTAEFVGLINDVAPFAFPKDDLPDVNVVRLEWDGDMLHTTATDTMRAARSSWHPDDDPHNAKNVQDAMFTVYGGADDRWALIAGLADAKELVKIYKLSDKEAQSPLTLDYDGGRLKVRRSRDTGHQAITTIVEGRMVEFPDVGKLLDAEPRIEGVEEIHYAGRHLADFGTVRQRGTMRLTFGGPTRATRVTIGDRFLGTIRPERMGDRSGATLTLVGAEG